MSLPWETFLSILYMLFRHVLLFSSGICGYGRHLEDLWLVILISSFVFLLIYVKMLHKNIAPHWYVSNGVITSRKPKPLDLHHLKTAKPWLTFMVRHRY